MDDAGRNRPRKKDLKRKKGVSGRAEPRGQQRVRIVIADDDPTMLDTLSGLLEKHFEIVYRAANGRDLLKAVEKHAPAVVVTDISMPEVNGIEAARQITTTYQDVKVVMLSVHTDVAFIDAAFEAGAAGYVFKLDASTKLISAIRAALDGRPWRPKGMN